MNATRVVTLSLLWVGVLVVVSRRWLGDVRGYIVSAVNSGYDKKLPPSSSTTPKQAGGGGGGGGGGSF